MENIIYKSAENFGELLAELHESEEVISVVGDFYTIRDILSEIVLYDEFFIDSIVLEDPDINGYEDEYILSVFNYGAISINKAKKDGEYIVVDEDEVVFVFEDVNNKFMLKNREAVIIEVDYCDGDCDNCDFKDDDGYITEYSHSDDGELCGYTRSKTENGAYYSESFYSTDPKLVQFQLNKKNF